MTFSQDYNEYFILTLHDIKTCKRRKDNSEVKKEKRGGGGVGGGDDGSAGIQI